MLRDPRDLRIPGPTPVPPQVMEAMQQPMVPHRGPVMADLMSGLQRQLKDIFKTESDVYVVAGTGSIGFEASIVNTLVPGDKVLAIVNGNFGVRYGDVAEALGMNVVRLEVEWGKATRGADVEAALKEHPDVRAVLLTQNETSTGVLNRVDEIGQVVRNHGALLFVDAVSGVPGARLDMDAWNCDVVFTASQKAFMCPPGLSIMGVGPRVFEQADRATMPRFILDFKRMRDALARGSTPSTAPLTLLYALKAACDMIEEESHETFLQRHVEQGEYMRKELQRLGLKLVSEEGYESPTVTAAYTPEGITAPEVVAAMRDRHGIHIATSQAKLQESVIRIGHMGWSDYPELERTIAALDDVLEHIPVGAAR